MAQRFKFNILTGDTAPDKYAAISPKDPFTFYLLETGTGYIGEKKLFDSNNVETLDAINPDAPSDKIPSEAAIVEFVNQVVENRIPYEIDGVPGNGTSGTDTEGTTIQEYDTDDGWHVRKWSNGYIEMMYPFSMSSIAITEPAPGNHHFAKILGNKQIPVSLVSKYSEHCDIIFLDYTSLCWVSQYGPNVELNKTSLYALHSTGSNTTGSAQFCLNVTGRWK